MNTTKICKSLCLSFLLCLFAGRNLIAADRFQLAGDIVTDRVSGLQWEYQTVAAVANWSDSVARCDSMQASGFTDWRLPKPKELSTIAESGRNSHGIYVNGSYFPSIASGLPARYWTSIAAAQISGWAYFLDFSLPSLGAKSNAFGYGSLCVRAGF